MQLLRPSVFLLVAVLVATVAASPTPFQGRAGPGGPAHDNQRHGSVGGHVQRDRGVGTSVHIQGQGDAWRSRDGNSRVHVDGHYGQVVHGPAKGAKDYGGNVVFEHKF